VHTLHQEHEYENSQGEVIVIFVAIHRTEIDALQFWRCEIWLADRTPENAAIVPWHLHRITID
jgi:hypothetical protein